MGLSHIRSSCPRRRASVSKEGAVWHDCFKYHIRSLLDRPPSRAMTIITRFGFQSLRLQSDRLDQRSAFGFLAVDDGGVLLRRARQWLGAFGGKSLLHLIGRQRRSER